MFSAKRNQSRCPACGKEGIGPVDRFRWRDFDGSLFNMEADLLACGECGFVRVGVPFDDVRIAEHYARHSLYNSLGGVGVGGSTAEDLVRYEHYLAVLGDITESADSIADIGCSGGGLLTFLQDRIGGGKRLTGIDVDMRALDALAGIEAVEGNALELNLNGDSLDLAIYTHVIEHILDLDGVFAEMTRVVQKGGHVLIEVPDATGYSEARVHDFYWMGMKEHVNHFTPGALCNLLRRHGIEVRRVARNRFPMRGGVHYPSLLVLGGVTRKTDPDSRAIENGADWLVEHMSREHEFAATTRHKLEAFLSGRGAPVVWGMGLEYFNLLALDVLPVDSVFALVDSNPTKQALTVSGRPVLAPAQAFSRGPLVCTASLSRLPILEQARVMGFDEKKMFFI